MKDLPRIVAETPIDHSVKIEVWRNGKTIEVGVKVGELPDDATTRKIKAAPDEKHMEMLGMTLSNLNESLRRRFKLDSRAKGVLVLDVKEGSAGMKGGLQSGDLIVEVAPDSVSSPEDFKDRIEKARTAKRKTVLLLTERKKVRQFIVLPVTEG